MLALLLTRSHEVDSAVLQCLDSCLALSHVALCEVLGCLLIPVAHIAVVMNLIEGLQGEGSPLIGIYART